MLDKGQDPDDINADFLAFRQTLQSHVHALVGELSKLDKMNDKAVAATCAQIDQFVRDYSTFITRFTATRAAHENQAASHEDVVNIRREWGAISGRINMFRNEVNLWTLMKPLVQTQVAARRKRIPLYEKTRSSTSLMQHAASDDVFNWVHRVLNQEAQTEDAIESGCFPDIALPNSEFHQHLHAAYRVLLAQGGEPPVRFLDVGCGGGLKVLSALRYFQDAHGLDYQQSYVDQAQAMLAASGVPNAKAFQADALTFDGYEAYDVIYFYRPVQDHEKLIEMEQRIVAKARPGTILIAPYVGFGERYLDLGCGRIAGHVYLSQSSQSNADKWRRKAEKTGVAVVHVDEERVTNVWTPLLSKSRRCGYDVTRYPSPV